MMKDTDKKYCSILLDVLTEKGVTDVVCSPGSRNTPLLIGVASRPALKKHFVIDERSAAFFALGIALVSKRPVALICTSGTALLNYAPAIAEAYYQSIPLIVISADRPIQWIDQDDSQTLRQDSALANFIKKNYSIPASDEDNTEMQWYINRIANDAMDEACGGQPGPVHINIHLAEPLGGKRNVEETRPRIINSIIGDAIANKEIIKDLGKQLSEAKVMLVAGFGLPDSSLQKALADFCRFPNVTVMAETISNLHFKDEAYSIDSVLTAYHPDIPEALNPDIVISIGGALVSRKLKEYLRRLAGKYQHWHIGYSHTTSDPFMSLTLRIEVDPARFFRNLNTALRKLNPKGEYRKMWAEKRDLALKLKNDFIRQCEWSELKAFDYVLNKIPSGCNLFLSNGTAIRYAQIIRYNLPHASYCNRGVSGIDGSVSTAVGGATAYKGKTLLITGDLSMVYDIGALGLKEIPEKFKIIVMDNQGGGIFRFIPSTSGLEEREEYFCMPPLLPLKNLAEGYGWLYFESKGEDSLRNNLEEFLACEKKAIMRIVCDGIKSAEILKGYMRVSTD